MSTKNDDTQRFGGPGSSHQDREHPGKNHQETGHKHGGGHPGAKPVPDAPANTEHGKKSGTEGDR